MKSLLKKIISELEAGAKPTFKNEIIGRHVLVNIESDGQVFDFKIPYLEIMGQMLSSGIATEFNFEGNMVKLQRKGSNDWHPLHYAFDEMEPIAKSLLVTLALKNHLQSAINILNTDLDPESLFYLLKTDYNLIEAQALLWMINQKPTINNYGPRLYIQHLREHLTIQHHIFPLTISERLRNIGSEIKRLNTPLKHLLKNAVWQAPYQSDMTGNVDELVGYYSQS